MRRVLQVRGNLRGNREEVFDIVCKRLESEFGTWLLLANALNAMCRMFLACNSQCNVNSVDQYLSIFHLY